MTTPSPPSVATPTGGLRGAIGPSDLRLFGLSAAGMAASFVTDVIDVGRVVPFVVSAVAPALLGRPGRPAGGALRGPPGGRGPRGPPAGVGDPPAGVCC